MPHDSALTHAVPAPLFVPISSHPPRDFLDALLVSVILAGLASLIYTAVATNLLQALTEEAQRGDWHLLVRRPTFLWLAMGLVLLTIRTLLWLSYRPIAPASHAQAPSLTVIIPAYNEGSMVERSIHSVVLADYPRDRLEIIVVDDGSVDDTWRYIELAARRNPDLIDAVRFEHNQGKRAALAEGFRRARGEIVITIDSDSVIERDALLAIAAPFQKPEVGAVAGKVAVLNRESGLLPGMLHVRFVLGFDFLRSAQSTYGTVYCCPGALSAYRTHVVRSVLEGWEQQTFLGSRCTFGEDRALTNMLLARGYDSVYQGNAVVHTIVPATYRKLCQMYLRWTRSYVREEFLFLRDVVWKRAGMKGTLAFAETLVSNLRYPVGYTAIVLWVLRAYDDPHTLIRMLFAVGTAASFYTLYYLRSERSWNYVFGVLYAYFSLFALTWIFPYALFTVRARGWLTR
jgi:hyaluronan synthase